MTVETLIARYGYVALSAGVMLEGEMVLIIAGYAAHRGFLVLHWVILVAFVSSFLIDQFWFHIGAIRGRAMIDRRPEWKQRAAVVREHVTKRSLPVVLSFRFLPGTRTLVPIVLGSIGFNARRFLLLNGLCALLWSVVMASAGYILGQAVELVVKEVERYELYVLAGLVLAGAVFWLLRRWRMRNQHPASRQPSGDPAPADTEPEERQ